ncbi:ribonuclease Z [Dinghuibacter silviterrae]|uniref:Ribonuclease Z n=1 Tax=Dinghuibacter silviterrae TaxID=1539049 RepID=A0A4R8DFW8_9BACT|nr:ribonuclease Z [Dinghuibacter silviterrae]TDW95996.1 ribonuclease Z [Dinghuibacter silviterrae]
MQGVTILGNNSAVPAFDRHPTAQVLTARDHLYLIDCGEGTQIQIIHYKIRRSKIHRIFISHLHGDHYFGLIGLINSMGLLGRIQPLHIHGPEPLWQILQLQLREADTHLPFDLQFHPLPEEGFVAEDKNTTVHCFRTNHRIACWGFLFEEKQPTRTERAAGRDRGMSYAFCADTKYDLSLVEKIKGADWVYHETTYLDDLRANAEMRYHSTTRQAAEIARLAGAGNLLIGHFSSKYADLEPFLEEAQEVFPRTYLALEGTTFLFK